MLAMVDVYLKISGEVQNGRDKLHGKDSYRAIGGAADAYKKSAALLAGITPPAAGDPDFDKYQIAEARIAKLKEKIRGYARQCIDERVKSTRGHIKDVGSDVERYRQGGVHVRASKNPLKLVRFGKPSYSAFNTKTTNLASEIKDTESYAKNVFDKLDDAGLREADDTAYANSLKARLKEARKKLEGSKQRVDVIRQFDWIKKSSR